MDWLGKMIGLPEEFLHTHRDSTGGGVIQVGNLAHAVKLIRQELAN